MISYFLGWVVNKTTLTFSCYSNTTNNRKQNMGFAFYEIILKIDFSHVLTSNKFRGEDKFS
jgi:hypothetical protein